MLSSSKPIQARIAVELYPRGGSDATPQIYTFDYYSLDSRLLALALKDYLLPVAEAVDKRNCVPRSDIGSIRDPFVYFPDRHPVSYSIASLRLEQIRHFIVDKLPDPQPRLF